MQISQVPFLQKSLLDFTIHEWAYFECMFLAAPLAMKYSKMIFAADDQHKKEQRITSQALRTEGR